MRTEQIEFFSEGLRVSGLWRTPACVSDPLRAVVHGPGWLGLKEAKLYERYHRAFTMAGFGVLVFDYRGSGESEGERNVVSPAGQLLDLINAVTYLTTRADVCPDAIGCFGTGGTGGGNAVLLASRDPRIRAVVSQVPVADGVDWLHRMRPEHAWLSFLADIEEDRRQRVLAGAGRLVQARGEIMIATPERSATAVKADVDGRAPTMVRLQAAEEILSYRPIDAAAGLATPLLVIGVEDDATTPTDHAVRLYEAARGPKSLIMQRHTSHYAAYDRYREQITPRIVAWLDRYVRPADIVIRTCDGPPGQQAETWEALT